MGHPTVEQHLSDCLDACELRRMGLLDGRTYRIEAGIRWPKLAPDSRSVRHHSRSPERPTAKFRYFMGARVSDNEAAVAGL